MTTTATITTPTTESYTGWYRPRPGAEWRLILEAASHAAALDALLDTCRRRSGDLCVLPSDQKPDRLYVSRGVNSQRPVTAGLHVR
jgi:hypothetical protein